MLADRADNATLTGVMINADCGLGIRGIRHVAGDWSCEHPSPDLRLATPMMEFIHPAQPGVEQAVRAALPIWQQKWPPSIRS
jgi:hypothetical protein